MTTLKMVMCVNASGLRNLVEGKTYPVIRELDNDYIVLDEKGNEHEYFKHRFTDLNSTTIVKQVVAVDVDDLKYLTDGHTYDVVEELEDDYIVINDKGRAHEYYKHRFQDVEDTIQAGVVGGEIVRKAFERVAEENEYAAMTVSVTIDLPIDRLSDLQDFLENI